jgi:hypothetical protein
MDLFESIESLPSSVKEIVEKYGSTGDELEYNELKEFLKEME